METREYQIRKQRQSGGGATGFSTINQEDREKLIVTERDFVENSSRHNDDSIDECERKFCLDVEQMDE